MALYVDDMLASGASAVDELTEQIPKIFQSKKKEYPHSYLLGI